MKTTFKSIALLLSLVFTTGVFSATSHAVMKLPVHVVFSAKAYWDGPSKSCIPREKGGCCHIWLDGMEPGAGEITADIVLVKDKIIQATVSRGKGMTKETFMRYFSEGKFNIDGPITFDPAVLSRLCIDAGYVVPTGAYPVNTNGDQMTIIFR